MARFAFPSVLALVASGLYWLTRIDRLSPAAMYAVEIDSSLGFPLWVPIAFAALIAGLVATIRLLSGSVAPARRRSGPKEAPAPVFTPPAGSDWYVECRSRAEALPLAPHGEVRFDEGWDLPFSLRLRQVTMEQARRRIDAFVGFLHGIPRPHKARVTIESSPDVTLAHPHLVAAHLKRRFPEDTFYVMEHGGGVDVVFAAPDPRWAARTR